MRVLLSILIVMLMVGSTVTADARGGRSSDDCPVGSKDPDCR